MNRPGITTSVLILIVAIASTAIAETDSTLTNVSQTSSVETPVSRTLELQTLAKH